MGKNGRIEGLNMEEVGREENMIKLHHIKAQRIKRYIFKGPGKKKTGVRMVNKESIWLNIHDNV